MISQNFICSKPNSIFCVVKYPDNNVPDSAVLLLPGFGESKSDLDYFLDNLSDYFIENGFATVQVDFFAHGDSFGGFENISSNILSENINNAIEYISGRLGLRVFIVSRGVYIELLADLNILQNIDGVVCINPIKLENEIVDYLDKTFCIDGSLLEFSEFENRELVNKFLTVLGAEPDNLMAQKISASFMNEIFFLLKVKSWDKLTYKNVVWITSNSETDSINVDYFYSKIPYKTIEFYEGYGFPRDILWQYQLSIRILASIIYMKKGIPHEYTVSIPKSR